MEKDPWLDDTLEVFKKAEAKRKATFRKNLPSYIWLVTKDVFALFIIFGVLSSASIAFETILFSLLVLIYISIEGFFSSYGYKNMQVVFGLSNELLQIKQLLKYQENSEEKEKREKALELFHKLETHVMIHSLFLLLFFLIVLWNLWNAISF